MHTIVECVPNISEGRDLVKIQAIVDAAASVPGCHVLGVEPDHDYHRTVITLAGSPESMVSAATALILKSIELLDMRSHVGEHPRLGVVDVCPFVPIAGSSYEECAELARQTMERVLEVIEVPIYLYGNAATCKERELLSDLRKGEYEGLQARLNGKDKIHTPLTSLPEQGALDWSTTIAKSGGITIGARPILVAYNVNVNEKDAQIAKKIGSILRSTGRIIKSDLGGQIRLNGMLKMVQGMGVVCEELGVSQVSMNLRDIEQCPLHLAFMACKSLASDFGVEIEGSEIVGLVPLQALLDAGRYFDAQEEDEEQLVKIAIQSLGLNHHHSFDPQSGIIEWAIKSKVIE